MIPRYDFRERVMHWLTAIAYSYCLLTGLAFYSPHLFWIAQVLGGAPTSRFWHPISGVAFLLTSVWMHSIWHRQMEVTEADREWLDHTRDYAENHDKSVPPADRFNAGQKLFYWLMFYSAVALLITGIIMWFPEYVPFSLEWIRQLAIFLHVCAALVTIGAFIVHVYMGVFFVPGSSTAMLFGYVPAAWARTHHRLWYNRVAGAKPEAVQEK
ncbi:MAG: formate dehydrogenase subunit gamma [Bryobacterales bacterium]|nr:formate dehydrogenase subunit gamma [Bryobacterales bacterium]